jgi:hypothetical protein
MSVLTCEINIILKNIDNILRDQHTLNSNELDNTIQSIQDRILILRKRYKDNKNEINLLDERLDSTLSVLSL